MLDLIPVIFNIVFSLLKLAINIAVFVIRLGLHIWQRLTSGGRRDLQSFSRSGFAIDGDTLGFGQHRVRLFGIDAPEKGQRQGGHATRALRDLIEGQTLTVEPMEYDQYGRMVAQVYLEDGRDLAQVLVAEGWARAATAYSSTYASDMRDAQRNSRGLWASAAGIPDPAAFRALSR